MSTSADKKYLIVPKGKTDPFVVRANQIGIGTNVISLYDGESNIVAFLSIEEVVAVIDQSRIEASE